MQIQWIPHFSSQWTTTSVLSERCWAPIRPQWEFSVLLVMQDRISRYEASLVVSFHVFLSFLPSTGFPVVPNLGWDGAGHRGSQLSSSWSQAGTPPLAPGLEEGQAPLKAHHKWQRGSGTQRCGWEPHNDLLPHNLEDVFHTSAYEQLKLLEVLGYCWQLLTSCFSCPSTPSLNSKSYILTNEAKQMFCWKQYHQRDWEGT